MPDYTLEAVALILFWFLVVVFGFNDALTSQVISVAFYCEREMSHKFCYEALISA